MACPANGWPSVSPQSLCRICARMTRMVRSICNRLLHDLRSIPVRIFSRKKPPECLQKSSGRVPGASPAPPRTIPERLQTGSQSNFEKNRAPMAAHDCQNASAQLSKPSGWRFLGPGRSPKTDQKRAWDRKSVSADSAGTDFLRFLAPLSVRVALRIDFWRG